MSVPHTERGQHGGSDGLDCVRLLGDLVENAPNVSGALTPQAGVTRSPSEERERPEITTGGIREREGLAGTFTYVQCRKLGNEVLILPSSQFNC